MFKINVQTLVNGHRGCQVFDLHIVYVKIVFRERQVLQLCYNVCFDDHTN